MCERKRVEPRGGEPQQNEALFVVGFFNHNRPGVWPSASEEA